MKNEYLFLSDIHRSTVEAYRPDGVTVEVSSIENTPLWIAAYLLDNKNEESAKKLSEVHSTILQYAPMVLSCESSEYYNRILFPLVNELERKLRKLLYLAASISDDKQAKDSIKYLEEKDFGEIFDLLFIDQNFIVDIKKRINADSKSEFNGRSKYSKEEIKTYLNKLVEHTLWDNILGEKDVPTLRSRFRDVQTFRNTVMHAHNIGREIFGKAAYLFDKINKELEASILKLIGTTEGNTTELKPEVNTAISSALVAMNLSMISDVLKGAALSSGVLKMSSQMSEALQSLPPLSANVAWAEVLKDNLAFSEVLRNATDFQTSPATENLRLQMSLISEVMRPYQQLADNLKLYSAFQKTSHSITEDLSRDLTSTDKLDDTDEEEAENDNEKSK